MPKQETPHVRAAAATCAVPSAQLPAVVLDTNAVLDWLVFRDPAMAPVGRAIECGQLRWLCCKGMQAECEHVVRRAELQRWSPDSRMVCETWARHAHEMPCPELGGGWPRCSDADDQVFIDLAIAQRAQWLITRDRALLTLARRAAVWGVCVAPPQHWSSVPPPH
jgi:uncharacterized protein